MRLSQKTKLGGGHVAIRETNLYLATLEVAAGLPTRVISGENSSDLQGMSHDTALENFYRWCDTRHALCRISPGWVKTHTHLES